MRRLVQRHRARLIGLVAAVSVDTGRTPASLPATGVGTGGP